MFNVELSNPIPVIDTNKAKTESVETSELSYNKDSQRPDTDFYGIEERWNQVQQKRAEEQVAIESAEAEKEASTVIPDMVRNALILAGFLLGAMAWWISLTSLINLFRRDFKPRHLVMINRIAGIIIIVLGVYTFVSEIIKL